MSNCDLFCNYQKCRKIVKDYAWVTRCFHLFCEEDGYKVFEYNKKCLTCNLELTQRYDCVRINLHPTEEFKSMVLAGLRPEITLEITARSIRFWNNQIINERMYEASAAKHWSDRFAKLELEYRTLFLRTKNEHDVETKRLKENKDKLEIQTKRVKELEHRLYEKVQLIQNLQSKYEYLQTSVLVEESKNSIIPSRICNCLINQRSLFDSETSSNQNYKDKVTDEKEFQFKLFPSNSQKST